MTALATAHALERAVRAEGGLCAEFMDVKHVIRDGVYTRAGTVKCGKIVLGTVHLRRNLFHLSIGQMVIFDNINGTRFVQGPHTEVTFPGMQRVGIALTDVVGCNIYETPLTDWKEIEKELFAPFTIPADIGKKILALAEFGGCELRMLNETPTKNLLAA